MSNPIHVDERHAFQVIAETINRSTDLPELLNNVLRTLVEITGLQTGWIFLLEDMPDYALAADYRLPPALHAEEKRRLKRGSCWCIEWYRQGAKFRAENTMHCKRLEDAVKYAWGDTAGITHHATIPLHAGDRLYGVLNVAAPGKTHYAPDELTLLQSVAYQIGTAIERTLLYQSRLKQAELLQRMGELSGELAGVADWRDIPGRIARAAGELLNCRSAAVHMAESGELACIAFWEEGRLSRKAMRTNALTRQRLRSVFAEKAAQRWNPAAAVPGKGRNRAGRAERIAAAAAVPILLRDRAIGVLYADSGEAKHFDPVVMDMLHRAAELVSRGHEAAQFREQQLKLAMWQERNRLARDLHDSVSQKLFALQLTAHGMESLLASSRTADALAALSEMRELTKDAVCEMKSLIWQLRPAGLEEGLLTGLVRYGITQGISVETRADSLLELPRHMEETLFRIGQEAINNVRKHAKTDAVRIRLVKEEACVRMEITDDGIGMAKLRNNAGLGITGMRERAGTCGGTFQLESVPRKGTVIRVELPCRKGGEEA
ncbi:MAG: GAF domain-containing sensor histidine kinase [Paenibacillus dendritiformis]|uniref:GAF domain-containing sensor histidine kinase n=1 Tax=uncultured Paenibacillus sp. TaxID=227322 RepID=UPI0025E93257|nr:GAF domain-containing sensor histidine kinase [uncultured Paenibacillus sp.]MDU5144431.1 GAF domain-containing sensor histidine kinase [Paenibacillus dendritiformis]